MVKMRYDGTRSVTFQTYSDDGEMIRYHFESGQYTEVDADHVEYLPDSQYSKKPGPRPEDGDGSSEDSSGESQDKPAMNNNESGD